MTSGQKRRKEEKETKKERGRVRKERCAERRKEALLGVLHLLGCASSTPWGAVGSRGFLANKLRVLSLQLDVNSVFRVPFAVTAALPGLCLSARKLFRPPWPHVLTLFSALVSAWASPPPEPPQACAGLGVLSVPITPPVTLCGHCVVLCLPPPGSCCRGSHGLFIAIPQNAAGNLALRRCSINIRGMNE